MKIRGGILGGVCLAGIAALTACTPTSVDTAPRPTPSSSEAPAPVPTPTEEPLTAASIVVSSSGIKVLGGEGDLLAEFSYFEPSVDVAGELADLTGVEPTIEPYAGGGDTPPGTSYDWGSIMLRDGWTVDEPFYPAYHAFITGNTVGTAAISAIGGIAVGDDFDAVAAEHPFDNGLGAGNAFLDILNLPESPESPGYQRTFSVFVIGEADGGQVTKLIAPSANWGA